MRKTQESLNESEFKKKEPKISSEYGEKKEISVEGKEKSSEGKEKSIEGKEGVHKLEKKKKKKKDRKRLAKGIFKLIFFL